MAREDLGASVREEDSWNQKRLAAKLVSGPRERLARPVDTGRPRVATATAAAASGKIWRPPTADAQM